MSKILIAILIIGLTITPLSYVQGSSDKHGHGNHDHDAKDDHKTNSKDEHDSHGPGAEKNHDDHKTDDKDGHDSHGHGAEENHDDRKTDAKDGHDSHGHGAEKNHDDHKTDAKDGHDSHGQDTEENHDDHKTDAKDGHDNHGHGTEENHEQPSSTSLNAEQQMLAGIQVEKLSAKKVDYKIYAPGEFLTNGYSSYQVSPRVASVILKRHVSLGDYVEKGQPLVTMFSEKVAQAQASYRSAWPEWKRVQKLGRQTVGEKRYINAKTAFEADKATLQAFGLSLSDIQKLTSQKTLSLGEYTLVAKIDGAVLSDDFEQGKLVEAGSPIILLADETQLWVEAHIASNFSLTLGVGTLAEVIAGDIRVKATVTQEAHTIDPVTRTRIVRLLVDNPLHRLHPGQFAEVFFHFSTKEPVIAVPETALMRNTDGEWIVFVEDHPGEFEAVEIELKRSFGKLREISGIKPGTRIVTQGAFFVASQIAKGGFDPHNH